MPPLGPNYESFKYRGETRLEKVKAKEQAISEQVASIMQFLPEPQTRGILRMIAPQLVPEPAPKVWSARARYEVDGMDVGTYMEAFLAPTGSSSACLFTRVVKAESLDGPLTTLGPIEPRALIHMDGTPILGSESPILAIGDMDEGVYLNRMVLHQRERFVRNVQEVVELIDTATPAEAVLSA